MSTMKNNKKKGGGNSATSTHFTKKRKFDDSKKKIINAEDTSASNKKRALKHARQSHRPHFDSVNSSKELWNKIRVKTNTPEENKEIMQKLMSSLTGKFHQVAMQHDASRVVQAAVQFGDNAQRFVIVKELCEAGNIAELAKVQYAHFLVLKIIKCSHKDDRIVKLIIKSLKGQIAKLSVHAVGARVVELLFATFSPKSTAKLKLELYGPRFSLFTDTMELGNTTASHPTLSSLIKSQPSAKPAALEFVLSSIINKGIDKGLYSFAYFQQILCEYVTTASPNSVRAFTPSIVDNSIHLLSTKAGARVVAECASYGTPKDRKRILRSLKGYTRSSLLHSDAYITILRILDVTDDTVNVQKSMLAELLQLSSENTKMNEITKIDEGCEREEQEKSPLLDLALSETGSKLFLFLLAKTDQKRKKYFDPSELEILHPNPVITQDAEKIPTSKKNSNTRRTELLQYMKKAIVELCESHPELLLRSICGSKVLRETCETFPSMKLVSSIADTCSSKNGKSSLSMFEDPVGHLAIKNIIMSESYEMSKRETNSLSLAWTLYERHKGRLLDEIASSSRGAFVLSAMVAVDSKIKAELIHKKSDIQKIVDAGNLVTKSNAGYHALMKALDGHVWL